MEAPNKVSCTEERWLRCRKDKLGYVPRSRTFHLMLGQERRILSDGYELLQKVGI